MLDRPDASALLEVVIEALRETIIPALHGPAQYQARVAANVLGLVARERQGGPAAEKADLERLQRLLGRDDAELELLTQALADAIRSGDAPLDDPDVVEYLWSTTLAKVAIDQPKFARYRRLKS